jgi:hypothetical protein
VAATTGKEHRGVVPVVGATVGMPHDYDDDRLFVYLRLDTAADNPDLNARALQEAGHPLVTLELRSLHDVGAEFFRWMFAVCAACIVLGVNPFEEPDQPESAYGTAQLPALREGGLRLYADENTARLLRDLRLQRAYEGTELTGMLAAFLGLARSGDYIALLAYLPPTAENSETLERLRRRTRHTFKRAVTLGFGPRYLDLTGQLHKGGPDKGLLVLITSDEGGARAAAGDYAALTARGRRVVRLHSEGEDGGAAALQKLAQAVEAAAAKRR